MADLQQEYGFFNYDEAVLESTGQYDRQYTAEDFAKYFALFIGNGVFANPASQLMVKIADTRQTPYNVTVEPGWAFINGYWYHLQQKATLTIPVNTSAQTKYQRVVVRCNNTTREIGLTIVEAAGETISPARNDAIYDLALAQVTVKSNASALSASDVKDLRPNSKYCGYVAGAINQIDAGTLYDNLTEQFNVWFEGIKKQLDGDVATNLQKQIGSLENLNTTNKTDLVSSVNEVLQNENGNAEKIEGLTNSKQDASTAITTSNIGSQSVKYATSAGSANAVAWSKVTGKPSSYPPATHNHAEQSLNPASLEISAVTPFIDFHHNKSSKDYTTRIIDDGNALCFLNSVNNSFMFKGYQNHEVVITAVGEFSAHNDSCVLRSPYNVQCTNLDGNTYIPVFGESFTNPSSRLVKENIINMSEEEAKKILLLNPVDFDYIKEFGGEKNQRGLIAEDVLNIIPSCVTVPDGYSEEEFDASKGIKNKVLAIDYSKLVPYLIKMVQIQQKEIEGLKKKVGGKNE